MRTRPGRSFAVKLTVLITGVSGLAAALVCAALVLVQVRRALDTAADMVRGHARVIASNSMAALDFDDPDAGRATLEGLAAVSEFAAAEISRADATLLARYERARDETLPAMPARNGTRVEGRWLSVGQTVVRDGEAIGRVTLLYDLAPVREQLLWDIAVAVMVTGAAMGLAFLAAKQLQRSLLRPVQELARAAGAIASGGDYGVRARKYSNDELGVLTDVFNDMLGRIEEAETLRRDHQAMLECEVALRSAEILDAQARLRQSERMASLGTLSAGLGHDIGNLLMPLRLRLSAIRERVVREGGVDAAEMEEDFTAIATATEYLQNLSSGLRLLARDADQGARTREPTALGAWWRVTEPLLRAAIGTRIELRHELPEDLPPVLMAKHLLTQVVFNLVQNAAQAMTPGGAPPPAGSRIVVRAERAETGGRTMVRLRVEDNGPGMTEEVKRRCMEPYFTTKTRGISSGLGLALVKGIVEKAGGVLELESALGEGTMFSVWLPMGAAVEPERPRAAVTLSDPRRRAVVSHLATSMGFRVGGAAGEGDERKAGGERTVWLTDSLSAVPADFRGRVVMVGEVPAGGAEGQGRVTVVDPAAPLAELRKVLQQCVQREADDVHSRR